MRQKKYQATSITRIPQEVLVIPCDTLEGAMVIATALNTGSVNTRMLYERHAWYLVKEAPEDRQWCVVLV